MMDMSKKQIEARKRISELKLRVSQVVDEVCKEHNFDVTYSEIFTAFFEILRGYAGQLLKDEWEEEDDSET